MHRHERLESDDWQRCIQGATLWFGWMACSVTNLQRAVSDTLILKNGSIVEGRCLNASDKNATEWQVETEGGLQLSLSRNEVKEPPRPLTAEQKKYAELLAKVQDNDSLELHRKIVEWCSAPENGLNSLADAHRERIVELDPTDKSAWAALGYLSTDEGWIRRDLYQKRRGLQQKGTRWYVPQDLAIQQANDQGSKLSAQVSKTVAKAIADVRTNSSKAAESRLYLSQLRDPLAVPKIGELLEKDRNNNNTQFRMQMIEILGRIRSGSSVLVLIDSALYDPDRNVRSESVSQLSEFGSEAAIQSMLRLLVNRQPEKDDPKIYDRVGEAMANFGDERSIPRLLDCLVTNHLRIPPPEPGYRAGTTSTGDVQFSPGQKKPEKVQVKNDGVLSALQTISKGENFGFDVQAWRNWYAKTYAAPNRNVLRDP